MRVASTTARPQHYMKFSELKLVPRLLRLPLAEEYVGGQQTLKALRRKGWLKPIIEHKGNTSFDVRDLDRAVDRLQVEGEAALFGSVDQIDAVIVRS
jgi:hypothetical protein